MSIVTVTVPATTANLGPGFDCIGAALNLANIFHFEVIEKNPAQPVVNIRVKGQEADKVSNDQDNLLYQSFSHLYQHLGRNLPSVNILIELGVPLARGLGSSATAIVGGLVAANYLAGKPLSQTEVMELAIAQEGHPDNVVPALLGNCQLAVGEMGHWQICQLSWHSQLIPVLAIPDFELSTEAARAVLPPNYSRADAVFNIGRMGLLVAALGENRGDWLKVALEDKIHQPYRQELIRGYWEVKQSAIAAGAYGMVISGAGPTLLALTDAKDTQNVVTAMRDSWQKLGVNAEVQALALDTQGANIIDN